MRKIGWYDVKTKFKHILRSILYSGFIQWLLCFLISSYIRFVVLTSKITYHNRKYIDNLIRDNKSLIIGAWHNRLSMTAFVFQKSKHLNKNYTLSALASDHGDGMIVANIMKNFGLEIVFGSTRKTNDPTKGIAVSSFRKIFKLLKSGSALCITPDGPRGPRFKVGGQVASIAKISGAPIIPTAFGVSRRKVFNSWDKFILPLPFSKISFYLGTPIYVNKNASEKVLEEKNKEIEKAINHACHRADEIVGVKPLN